MVVLWSVVTPYGVRLPGQTLPVPTVIGRGLGVIYRAQRTELTWCLMARHGDAGSGAHSPRRLFRLLYRIAFFSITVTITLTAIGTYYVYRGYVIDHAEDTAISISQSIVALKKHLLLHPVAGQGSRLIIDESERAELSRTLKSFLIPYDILKIKIFSTDKVVIYSTDSQIIGLHDPDNQRLELALGGTSVAKMQRRAEVYDLVDERRFDVDVVETYVPIRNELNQIVGSFEIYQDMTNYRTEINRGVITSVAILVVIVSVVFTIAYLMLRVVARQLDQAQKKLHKLATIDALTGVLNRREIMYQFNAEFSRYTRNRAKQSGACFSLIMADIDHFKSINDTYGHLVGDQVLREVAQRITSELRGYSALGRYGGEEFIITLPDSSREGAQAVAERIRLAVKVPPITIGTNSLQMTISLGVATALPEDTVFEQILKRADQCLYLAKKRGRDQVA